MSAAEAQVEGGGFFASTVSEGRIVCRPGYAPIGVRGKAGWELRHLAVHCRAVACVGATCGDDHLLSSDYWTDRFAGDREVGGGTDFDLACPTNKVLTGVTGTHVPGSVVRSFGIKCSTLEETGNGTSSFTSGLVGDTTRGISFTSSCKASEQLIGFHARTGDKEAKWIHGLQPVCSDHNARFSKPAGGTGGRGEYLQCPEGHDAFGTVQSFDGTMIRHFAVACSDGSTVRYYLSGGWRNDKTGIRYFSEVRGGQFPYTAPLGSKAAFCPSGHRLSGIDFRIENNRISGISALSCRSKSDGSLARVSVNVGGTNTSTSASVACSPSRKVDGMFIRAGWGLDQVRLHCR